MSSKGPSTMATTFHPFPRLPIELRLMIWEATISPRTIDVHGRTHNYDDDDDDDDDVHQGASIPGPESDPIGRILSFTPKGPKPVPPPPPILHTCRESRNVALKFHGGYQKAFSKLWLPHFDGSCSPRYIWVNFELDMIDIGGQPHWLFNKYRTRIRRLRVELHRHPHVWRMREFTLLKKEITISYKQLREICVCIPWEDAHLGLPPDWLPGGSDGAFMEGWRSVDWGRSCRDRDGDEDKDGERAEDRKTDENMWVLVLKKIDAIGNLLELE